MNACGSDQSQRELSAVGLWRGFRRQGQRSTSAGRSASGHGGKAWSTSWISSEHRVLYYVAWSPLPTVLYFSPMWNCTHACESQNHWSCIIRFNATEQKGFLLARARLQQLFAAEPPATSFVLTTLHTNAHQVKLKTTNSHHTFGDECQVLFCQRRQSSSLQEA